MIDSANPLPDPPKDCDSTSSHRNGEVVISFPPRGVFRTYSINLAFIGVFALAAVPLFFVRFDPAVLRLWRILPLSIWATGVYLLASTFQRGRTRTIVTIGKDRLSIENIGPFFSTRRSWPISKINAVSLTGYRLVSLTVERKVKRLPLDRSRSELRWLVETVRSSLSMPPQSSDCPPLPVATKVVWERNGERVKIVVPPEWASLVVVAAAFLLMLPVGIIRVFHPRPGDDMGAMLAMFSVPFIGFVAPLVLLWNRLKWPTTFEMTSTELAVVRPFLIGHRHHKWNRDEIEDVRANGQVLFVWFKRRSKRRAELILGGRPEDVRWVAAMIRHEMRLLIDDPETGVTNS